MSVVSFADVIHPFLTFDSDVENEALVLELIDTAWFQRLRDISQTANTRLVYMFSEHSRFGHCVGAAYLACQVIRNLEKSNNKEIAKYRNAISAAAILHDIGHLAPGSHVAQKVWFPNEPDTHELIGCRVINEDLEIIEILNKYDPELKSLVIDILTESDNVPAWTWELISGGGWNVDRGNWCSVDSVLSGVSYGLYNINALTDSISINSKQHLALKENRLDAMVHFAISRHAMYSQIYQHRVLLAADILTQNIVKRARYLFSKQELDFCDPLMSAVLKAKNASELTIDNLHNMKEFWWRYHLNQWQNSKDAVLKDLCTRLMKRKLFKTFRVNDENKDYVEIVKQILKEMGLAEKYYFSKVKTSDVNQGDFEKSMQVELFNGKSILLNEANSLFKTLLNTERNDTKTWLVFPSEVKKEFIKRIPK